jgi:hypothetical protein
VWSVPPSDSSLNSVAGSGSSALSGTVSPPAPQSFWSSTSLERESDLSSRILPGPGAAGGDAMDLSWSPDARRLVVCSLDGAASAYEREDLGDGSDVGNNGGDNGGSAKNA